MSDGEDSRQAHAHLEALGYSGQDFHRSMSLWSNMALGFTLPVTPGRGVLAVRLQPDDRWPAGHLVVGHRRLRPVPGGTRLRRGGVAVPDRRRNLPVDPAGCGVANTPGWSWVYLWAVIVTVTAVAEFGGHFVGALFGIESTPVVQLLTAVALLVLALLINFSGTHMLARIAKIGLAAELVGVIALGLYLLLFKRVNSFSVFFDSMGAGAARRTSSHSLVRRCPGCFSLLRV